MKQNPKLITFAPVYNGAIYLWLIFLKGLTVSEWAGDKKSNVAGHHSHIYLHVRAFVQIVTEAYL